MTFNNWELCQKSQRIIGESKPTPIDELESARENKEMELYSFKSGTPMTQLFNYPPMSRKSGKDNTSYLGSSRTIDYQDLLGGAS